MLTRLSQHLRDARVYADRCRKCFLDPAEIIEIERQAAAGNGQKNGAPKKRGPEKGRYAFITWDTLGEAFKRRGPLSTKATVAETLGVSESGIDKWLQREGIDWRAVQLRLINT